MKKSKNLSKSIVTGHDWLKESKSYKPYVEFGAQKNDSGERKVGKLVSGADAYDLWHLAVRFKEVLTCRKLINSEKITIKDIPRKRKFLIFYLLLAEYLEVDDIVELGCSVLELIDGLELVEKYFQDTYDNRLNVDVRNHKFIGVDTSDLMLQAASDIHQEYNIKLFNDALLFMESTKKCEGASRALFDLNVSSYAFSSSPSLANFLNTFDFAYLELALSKGKTFKSNSYSGIPITYFSLKDLIPILNKSLFFLFEKETNNKQWYINSLGEPVVNGFFIFGEPDRINSFFANATKFKEIEQYFIEDKVDLFEASNLLL